MTVRVLIAAATSAARTALEPGVASSPALTIVGAIDSLASLEDAVASSEPHVVLLDAGESMASVSRAIADIEHASSDAAVVVLADDDVALARRALAAGAVAVLPRMASVDELSLAIESAALGLATVRAETMRELVGARARAFAHDPLDARASSRPSLTPRESEILARLAEGLGNKQIAARLGISEHTVKTHVMSLFAKLGADTRAEAVALGLRSGLIVF